MRGLIERLERAHRLGLIPDINASASMGVAETRPTNLGELNLAEQQVLNLSGTDLEAAQTFPNGIVQLALRRSSQPEQRQQFSVSEPVQEAIPVESRRSPIWNRRGIVQHRRPTVTERSSELWKTTKNQFSTIFEKAMTRTRRTKSRGRRVAFA